MDDGDSGDKRSKNFLQCWVEGTLSDRLNYSVMFTWKSSFGIIDSS